MNRAKLREQLKRHEGLRLKPYKDTVGKLTIGVGRNLDDVGISYQEADALLESDISRVEDAVVRAIPEYAILPDVRQRVLLDMAFNLGVDGLLKFKRFLGLIRIANWEAAAEEMLASKWATQVGTRARVLSQMMKYGKDFV